MAGYQPIRIETGIDAGIGYDTVGNIHLFVGEGDWNTAGSWRVSSSDGYGTFNVQNGVTSSLISGAGAGNDLLLGSLENSLAGEGFGFVPQTGTLYALSASGALDSMVGFLPSSINGQPIAAFGAFNLNGNAAGVFSTADGSTEIYNLESGNIFGEQIKLDGFANVRDIDAFQAYSGSNMITISAVGNTECLESALNTYSVPIIPEPSMPIMMAIAAGAAALYRQRT